VILRGEDRRSQASLAVREVDELLKTLDGKTIESFDAKVIQAANPAFDSISPPTRKVADSDTNADGRQPGSRTR
jgi:hypothetical protein